MLQEEEGRTRSKTTIDMKKSSLITRQQATVNKHEIVFDKNNCR